MTLDAAQRQLISQMSECFDDREAATISSMVMEKLTGMDRSQRVIHKADPLSPDGEALFQRYLNDLMRQRPVQYVLGEAWFSGMKFYVDERVLVPRPETAELVDWVLSEMPAAAPGFRILDLGTGSGCIPVAIGKKRPDVLLMACDISPDALDVAKKNAADNQVAVDFFSCDILDPAAWDHIPAPGLITSNPPYIPEAQKQWLDKHVKDFEPAQALFVPDTDPLVFYKAIGRLAKKKLLPQGRIFLEVHHDFSRETVSWYRENGFSVELRQDLSGKNRMIRAQFL